MSAPFEKGDVVYVTEYGFPVHKTTVARVTRNCAFTMFGGHGWRFQRNTGAVCGSAVYRLKHPTEALDQAWRHKVVYEALQELARAAKMDCSPEMIRAAFKTWDGLEAGR